MHEWIDCTHALRTGMIVWPGDPPFTVRQATSIAAGDSTNATEFSGCAHVGTHVDAPAHVCDGGATVDALSLGILCGRALVVRVTKRRDIRASDLADQPIEPGDRVLLRTPNERLLTGDAFAREYCALATDAAQWLVDHGVRLVGVDYLSVDRFDALDLPVHRMLLGAGIVVIEGLDLAAVTPGRYEMVALPLKLAGADGAPARVIVRSCAS